MTLGSVSPTINTAFMLVTIPERKARQILLLLIAYARGGSQEVVLRSECHLQWS